MWHARHEPGYRVLLPAILAISRCSHHVTIEVTPAQLVADGESEVVVRMSPADCKLDVTGGRHSVTVERIEPGIARLRVGVIPAHMKLRARAPDGRTASAQLITTPDLANDNGMPDFLHLPLEDQQAFRRWFTFLAEAQYLRDPKTIPKEINDCAALIRYAYREALSEHTSDWANQLGLQAVPAIPSVRKYAYPYTPLKAGLFRTADDAFAEFADAHTLQRWNCHLVSRDVTRALPADLLFYKQIAEPARRPFHSMIFLGGDIVYHTGSAEGIRRLTLKELIGYPLAQWRPIPGNENFLGVYRWNILR
jgi:uncharacterized protein